MLIETNIVGQKMRDFNLAISVLLIVAFLLIAVNVVIRRKYVSVMRNIRKSRQLHFSGNQALAVGISTLTACIVAAMELYLNYIADQNSFFVTFAILAIGNFVGVLIASNITP